MSKRTVIMLAGTMSASAALSVLQSDITDNRLNFNWGYHEAAHDKMHNVPKRTEFSRCGRSNAEVTAYAAGYEFGWEDATEGVYANDSSEAWAKHKAR
jgi:hypothetical protein